MATTPVAGFWPRFEREIADSKYHLHRLLGNGEFGGVFLASEVDENDQERRQVAVKLILQIPGALERQLREVTAVCELNHDNILRCFDWGKCQMAGFSFLYLVTEVAENSLEDRLTRGVLTRDEARELAQQMASGLAYLHNPANPRVHRDLKPANILRVGNAWKIADFGLVRELGQRSVQLTAVAGGTPAYAPPELHLEGGTTISTAWDMWSFGVILVEALSGRNPFQATNSDFGTAVVNQEPFIPTTVGSPFNQIARGCLAKDRASRWSARQVLTALEGGQVEIPVSAPPRPPPVPVTSNWLRWSLAVAALLVVGFLAYYVKGPWTNSSPGSTSPPIVNATPTPRQRAPFTPAAPASSSPPREPSVTSPPKEPSVIPWNPSLAFSSSAVELAKGASAMLVWAVERSNYVTLNGELVASSGSRSVSPSETTTYDLVAYGPSSATRDRQVTIRVTEPDPVIPPRPTATPPTIVAFEAVPNPVEQCAVVILRWTVKEAATVSIDPAIGSVPASGYRAWRPLQGGQFTLKAEGPGGTVSRDAKVVVNHATRTACEQ
jgi:serine/threonine protein kinase